jgi:hypothetical protein
MISGHKQDAILESRTNANEGTNTVSMQIQGDYSFKRLSTLQNHTKSIYVANGKEKKNISPIYKARL